MPADRRALATPPAREAALKIYEICLVCLGNICRSPMAQAVLTAELAQAGLAGRVVVTSAGTGDWHLGEPMDRRARAELARHGYDGSAHRARQLRPDELDRYDLVLAMDQANLRALQRMAAGRPGLADRIRLLRDFDPGAPQEAEVPDPWGEAADAFAAVFDMIRAAARGLTASLAAQLAEPTRD